MHDGRDAHYLEVGLSALACIAEALGGAEPRRILDMPSGFGRVTRLLRARYPQAAITVCDLDRPGVDFAATCFSARPVYSVEDFTKLRLDETYDLVWVGSLFTHLSERQSRALLAALGRHMRPGGTLVASSHGTTIVDGLHDWGYGLEPAAVAGLLDDYRVSGYGHRGYGGSDGYGISMCDKFWWRDVSATTPFRLVSYQSQAWDHHQDIVVLNRVRRLGRSFGLMSRQERYSLEIDKVASAYREQASLYDPSLRSFDSAFYLAEYSDVAQSVARGEYLSAFQHYWRNGRFEKRLASPASASV